LELAGFIPGWGVATEGILAAWSTLEGEYKDACWHLVFMIPFTKWVKGAGKGAKFLRPLLRKAMRKSPKFRNSLKYAREHKAEIKKAGDILVHHVEKDLEKKAKKEKSIRIKQDIKDLFSFLDEIETEDGAVEEIEQGESTSEAEETEA